MATADILRRHLDVDIIHPNRDTPETLLARNAMIALLVVTGIMLTIVAVGGWNVLVGGRALLVAYIIVYFAMAWAIKDWRRGVLPVAAGAGTILIIFALVGGPSWFDRDFPDMTQSLLDPILLGIVTMALIPVQMVLIVVALWSFNQEWNLEEEVPRAQPPAGNPPVAMAE